MTPVNEGSSPWWQNFPVPEIPVFALAVAVLVRLLTHRETRPLPPWRLLIGSALVLGGGLLAASATKAAGDINLEHPERVVDVGPYAHTRHPMYLAWTGIYLGVAFLANLTWAWVLLPGVLALTDREARREENRLRRSLGPDYIEYTVRVPRYF